FGHMRRPSSITLFPYTPLFRSEGAVRAAARLVRCYPGIQNGADRLPVATGAVEKLLLGFLHFHRELHRPVVRQGLRGGEREGEPTVRPFAGAAQDGEAAPRRLVPSDREEVEFVAVVIGRQSRRLLEGGRADDDLRFRAVAVMLLPTRHQRLLEPAADGLAAEKAKRGAG